MKKNKAIRIAIALLVVAVLTTCGMTGSLAKYVDEFKAEGLVVRAGLFDVRAEPKVELEGELWCYSADGSLTAALATEGNALKYADTGSLPASGSPPVKTTAANIIVPGSLIKVKGFEIINYSEVDVTVALKELKITIPTVGGKKMPLYYCLDTTPAPVTMSPTSDGKDGWTAIPATGLITGLIPTGATQPQLKSYPFAAAGTTAAEKISNVYTTPSFWILWPFGITGTAPEGIGADGVQGQQWADDTVIGKAQATALLTGAGPVAATYTHVSGCTTVTGTFPVTNTTALGANCVAGATGCCKATSGVPADAVYVDAATSHLVKIEATVNAVQID